MILILLILSFLYNVFKHKSKTAKTIYCNIDPLEYQEFYLAT